MDGNTKLSEETVDYNSTVAIPSTPSKAGWVFKGWSTSEDTLVAFNSNTKITSNTTIYAYFVEEFTVTFNIDGTKTTAKVENGNKVTEPEAPTKSGYTFTGWYLDDTKFNFNTPITNSIELVAGFVSLQDAPIEITNYSGYNEGLFFEATPVVGASLSDYSVQYKLASDTSWKLVDEELIREENNKIRCDIVGIPAGSYQVKLDVNGKSKTISCAVAAQDRSGYAHFNYTSGIGAYKDDGTLKSDAIVVYVTNENKNTVTIDGYSYTGLVTIIQNQSKIKKPLDIRIIGKITTNQYAPKSDAPRLPDGSNNSSTFFTNSLESTYGDNLVGLTVQYMDKLAGKSYKFLTTTTGLAANGTGSSSVKTTTYSRDQYPALTGKTVLDDDSYFNMLDIASASNITLEGIGTNAEFFQFGITWKLCNSIEVKNITFTDYPEDACSFEAGSNSDVNNYGHYWVHNNTFNRGKNNWDVSGERDKYAGDGGIDLKYINSVTLAYNKFDNCKKTGLVGGDNKNYTKNITFHHNYYYKVESRLPLGRQANMHIYNNYYEECGTCQDIRANAFVFSEANYFYKCTTAQKVSTDSTYTGTVIKSFNDYYDGGSKYNSTQATKVNSRTQSLTGNCKPDGSTDYSNFDTNSTLFYYTGSASKVSVLHSNSEVPEFCKTNSGVLKSNITSSGTPDPTPSGEYSITYVSAHGTTPSKVTATSALPNPLPVLTETGWTFKGWYTKNTYEESSKAVAGATLTQNVTLYAKWEEAQGENPTTNKVTITFDSLATGTVTSVTTSTGATIQKGNSSKDIKIAEANKTVNGTQLSKYVNVAGGGNYTDLSIAFTTTKKANITIYYANPGSSGTDRYIALYTAAGLVDQTATGAAPGGSIVSYTYTNMAAGSYAATSKGSGLNIY
ncbi:MAG: InlB B-repeat-containing protein, partial [Anaeroplasmataceae bacterium]|nr:InlB B-repeat-containing protein [Anaeroplasmataceae bacterium]